MPECSDDVPDHGLVAGFAFGGAFVRPVAVQLSDRGARFVNVGCLSGVSPVGQRLSLVVGARGGCGRLEAGGRLGVVDAEG